VNQKSATSTKSEDDSLRRLLLCEVLLEEYESLSQPTLGHEVSDIKKEIDEYHAREKASDSELDEEEVNGKFVKDIYRLMREALQRRASEQANEEADKYRQLYSKLYKSLSETDLDKVVERAVIAEIYGHVDELKARYERKYISEADTTKRSSLVDEATLKAIHDEVLESPPDPTEQSSSRTKLSEFSRRRRCWNRTRRSRKGLCAHASLRLVPIGWRHSQRHLQSRYLARPCSSWPP
jgi:hypothetical protein